MKALRIVSKNVTPNWWCRNCKNSSRAIVKTDEGTFCDECVPEKFKDILVTVNQNREKLIKSIYNKEKNDEFWNIHKNI